MKIIVSQKNKKLSVEFKRGKIADKYSIDRAEGFLTCVDKFLKKRKMKVESLQKADLEFVNAGVLTERVIRATMAGLSFFIIKLSPCG